MLLLFLVSSLSPNQFCKLKTTAALVHWSVSALLYQPTVDDGAKPRAGLAHAPAVWASGRAYHPTYLLRIKTAAMGMVEERVDWNSGVSPLGAGS